MKKKNTVKLVGLVMLTTLVIAAIVSPDNSAKLPPEVTSGVRSIAPESPASWGRTRVSATPAPSPRPKPVKTSIFVQAPGIDSYWGVSKATADWNSKLKYAKLVSVAHCPSFQPCVTIKYNSKIKKEFAAETSFGYRNDLTIELNPKIHNREAIATISHELGHVLGVPHIIGTSNTVMNPQEVYRTTPSTLDGSYANRDRTWSVQEAYDSSNKTVDARAVPR